MKLTSLPPNPLLRIYFHYITDGLRSIIAYNSKALIITGIKQGGKALVSLLLLEQIDNKF